MHRDKKGGWRTTAAARILSVVLGASMVLSLMPCEGLAWAFAREEVAVQADDAAGALIDELEIEEVPDVDEGLAEDKDALAEGEDAEEAITEDQGDDLVVEEEDAVKAIVEEPAAAKGDNVPEWAVDDGAVRDARQGADPVGILLGVRWHRRGRVLDSLVHGRDLCRHCSGGQSPGSFRASPVLVRATSHHRG